jgi:ribosomal protein S27E
MAKTIAKCPKCGESIVTSKNGATKVRTRILVFQDNKCVVKCQKCGADIKVSFLSFAPVTENLVVLESGD